MIKAIIMDFGGVLFPVQPYLNEIKPEIKKFRQIKQLIIDIYNENERLINSRIYTKELFQKQLQEKGSKIFSKQEIDLIEQSILNKDYDLLAILKKLSNKCSIYALINEAPKWTELRIYFHDLNTIFKDYFISSYLGVRKPDPEIFKIFLKKTGLKPSECIFVDDKKENLESAEKLRIKVIPFINTDSLKLEFEKLGLK